MTTKIMYSERGHDYFPTPEGIFVCFKCGLVRPRSGPRKPCTNSLPEIKPRRASP